MKSPDEIKKGLVCYVRMCDGSCPPQCMGNECDLYTGNYSTTANVSDALAYIRQLEEHIRDLTKMIPEWYCVHDIIPGETKSYIICTENGAVCTARWYERSNSFNGVAGRHALYWMPLPSPPKEDE